MLDNGHVVFQTLAEALRNEYGTGIFIIGEEVTQSPPRFPAVSVVQADNYINTKYSTFDCRENAAVEEYKIEAYSNLVTGAYEQAREIARIVCEVMDEIGYTRTFNQPVKNADATVSRRVLRFHKSNLTEVI